MANSYETWSADSVSITADGICWTADGGNNCPIYAGAGYPVIIYETLPAKTIKQVVKKVKQYQEVEKQLSPASIDAIVGSMVESWATKDMQQKMELHSISQELALLAYERTIRQLIEDEDLALILILASI